MRFGPVPLEQAEGAILAHSLPLDGGRLRKGAVLTAADLARLAAAGVAQVTVARLETGDLHEDAAAGAVARALVPVDGAGLELRAVGTGRVNLHATLPGVVQVQADRVDALNAVDPMITLATLPRWRRVAAGEMVATVKIIAYGVAGASVRSASALASGALALRPAAVQTATLIETTVSGDGEDAGGDPNDKGRRSIQTRLRALGVELAPRIVVAHREDDLARAIAGAEADLILILTASATSDPQDVAPAALRRAGGVVERFGMPVDPGNLLFLGRLGDRPVIGLPGCAKSPALNGADWVMERLICGVPVTAAEIAAMGVGGLLKDTPHRGRMREG